MRRSCRLVRDLARQAFIDDDRANPKWLSPPAEANQYSGHF
jgi:hypothetical protein